MHKRRKNISPPLFAFLAEWMPCQVTVTNPAPCVDVSLMLIVAARKVLVVLLHCFLVCLAVTAFPAGKIRTAPSCGRHALAFWAASLHLHQKSPHGELLLQEG